MLLGSGDNAIQQYNFRLQTRDHLTEFLTGSQAISAALVFVQVKQRRRGNFNFSASFSFN